MRGTLRWARADLRAHRGQALLTIGVVGGVVAALFLASTLLQGALNPWQQLFARTHGADVLVYFQNGTDTSELRSLRGVQVAQPYQTASATLEQGAVRSPVELRSMTPVPPSMSTPLIVAGTWLRSSEQNGAVLEASFAAAVHVGVGDRIAVDGIDGTEVSMRVIGIADTADQGFYPQWTPGLIWVQHTLLTKVEPQPSETEKVVGLRLDDNSALATSQVVQTDLQLLQRRGRELSGLALLHLAAGPELDGQQRPAARTAARPVRDHRAGGRPVRDRQRHGGPRAHAAPGHRDAEGARFHSRPGGADAAGRAVRAGGGRRRARAGRRRASWPRRSSCGHPTVRRSAWPRSPGHGSC